MIAQRQFEDLSFQGYYNVGPDETDCVSTGELVSMFCEKWGNDLTWKEGSNQGPHEANFLKLDCSKIKKVFKWRPVWNIEKAIEKTCEWTKAYINGDDMNEVMKEQINEFIREAEI